ncbi:MAG: hypothetical protein PHV34_01870 [Verrucomicrobiae bacterium]|nr:hypothetical protein [Verrucomicrobiae bacterium]
MNSERIREIETRLAVIDAKEKIKCTDYAHYESSPCPPPEIE